MQAKIFPRILGGLGNQLFIYAAARRLSIVNKAELVIDDVSGFRFDKKYKRHYQLDHFSIPCHKATHSERLEPFSRIRRKVLRDWNNQRPLEQRTFLIQEGLNFDPRLLSFRLQKNRLFLEGYWQSESYFKDVELQIRKDLQIIPPKDAVNLDFEGRIRERISVAVHIRFFNTSSNLETIKGGNTPSSYYKFAVQAMEAKLYGAHYFIFSDFPESARNLIPLPDERISLIHHNFGDENAYADFWLMTKCQHFIIANSTFSWWGAWLAENRDKIVIAPKLDKSYGGTWECPELLPKEWIQL